VRDRLRASYAGETYGGLVARRSEFCKCDAMMTDLDQELEPNGSVKNFVAIKMTAPSRAKKTTARTVNPKIFCICFVTNISLDFEAVPLRL
jgi:hypothetical protein